MAKKIGLGLLALLILIQFFRIDKTNPESDPAQDFLTITQAPAEVATIVKAACYDCHSHESKYPWYTNIAPVSWVIGHHIEEGREHLNFSTWATYPQGKADHKLEECAEEVQKDKMPMKPYVLMHSEAKLTPEQKTMLVDWFNSKRNGESEEREEHEHH
jgi:hypothetical protein